MQIVKRVNGAPLPTARERTYYPWADLEPGDKLILEGEAAYKRACMAGRAAARARGWQIACHWSKDKGTGHILRLS